MAKQQNTTYLSNQAARYDNGKCIFEILFKLNPASVYNAYKIHAGTDEHYENGIPIKSVIEFGLMNYENQTKLQTSANISPSDLRWLAEKIRQNEFGDILSFSRVHAFKVDDKGLSPVYMFKVAREYKEGKPYERQWIVSIREGKAKAFTKGVGYVSNTYVETVKLFVRLSHKDMFDMVTSAITALDIWECVNGAKLYREREKLVQEWNSTKSA